MIMSYLQCNNSRIKLIIKFNYGMKCTCSIWLLLKEVWEGCWEDVREDGTPSENNNK